MAKRVYNRRIDPDFEAFNVRVAERINSLRVEKGLNQEDFALEANLHRTHIGQIENAKVDPTLSTLFKIAKVFGMTVEELLAVEESGSS